jgi:hypothetical protein
MIKEIIIIFNLYFLFSLFEIITINNKFLNQSSIHIINQVN